MASIRKLKSGRWQAQVKLKGQRRAESFPTKTEAKDWAAAREHEIKTAVVEMPSSSVTVAKILERYEVEVSRKKRGVVWEQGQIKRMLEKPMAKLKVQDVQKSDVRAWRDQRLKDGVKGSTILREWNLFSNVFAYARDEWELIVVNPFTGVKKPDDSPPRDRLVTHDEIEQLCWAAGFNGVPTMGQPTTHRQRSCLAFMFAIETAMRAGEICKLTMAMVDVEKRVAHIPAAITKSGKKRDAALTRRAVELLSLLPPNDGACFGLKSSQLDSSFRIIRDKTPIEDLHFHDSRHEAITRLAKKMPVMALARNVDHHNLNQLMVYYNETGEELAKLLD